MSDHDASFPGDLPADEMSEYLRLYLDETGEQLDALVNTLLALEADPANAAGLNEAFRLIHSIKGSSALLGLDRITTLTHHLESHFERLRWFPMPGEAAAELRGTIAGRCHGLGGCPTAR